MSFFSDDDKMYSSWKLIEKKEHVKVVSENRCWIYIEFLWKYDSKNILLFIKDGTIFRQAFQFIFNGFYICYFSTPSFTSMWFICIFTADFQLNLMKTNSWANSAPFWMLSLKKNHASAMAMVLEKKLRSKHLNVL